MDNEQKQILALIAELARAVAEFSGGTHEGVAYSDPRWRTKLEAIAKRAENLNIDEQSDSARERHGA